MPLSHGDEKSKVLTAIPRHLLPNYKGHVKYGVRGRHFFVRQASPLRFSTGDSFRTPTNPPFHYAKDHRSQKLHLYTITAAVEFRDWSLEELRLMDYQTKFKRLIPTPYPPPAPPDPQPPATLDHNCSAPMVTRFFQMQTSPGPSEDTGLTSCYPDTSDILWRPITELSSEDTNIFDEVSPFSTPIPIPLCTDEIFPWRIPGLITTNPDMYDAEIECSTSPTLDGISVEESRLGFYQEQPDPCTPQLSVFAPGYGETTTLDIVPDEPPFFTEKDHQNPSLLLHYQTISCMPQYRSMSIEELRARDYHVLRHQAAHELPATDESRTPPDENPMWTDSEVQLGTFDHTPSLHDLLQAYPGPTQLQPVRQQAERKVGHHDASQPQLPIFKPGAHPGHL